MKHINNIIFFAAIFLVLSSCEDYLTKTIEFEEVGYEPQIVINAKVKDSIDYMNISISQNVNYANNSNSEFQLIDGAEVKFFIDGDELAVEDEAFEVNNSSDLYNHHVKFPSGFDVANKEFSMEVSHPDYPTANTVTSINTFPEITNISFEENARTGTDFGYPIMQDATTFTIEDRDDGINYYKFGIRGDFDYNIEVDDPFAVELYFGGLIISDEDFNGSSKEFTVYSQNLEWDESDLTLIITNISESEYKFSDSYSTYQSAQDFGFFSEPVTLFTNIENGLGIFSAEQVQKFPIE
jgi:hypothetical protein